MCVYLCRLLCLFVSCSGRSVCPIQDIQSKEEKMFLCPGFPVQRMRGKDSNLEPEAFPPSPYEINMEQKRETRL